MNDEIADVWLETDCVTPKDRFTEAEALRILPDAEPVEGSQVSADHVGHVGWSFASGLVMREDGAMMRPDSVATVARWPTPDPK
jgi:hypothetical protein